MILHVITLMKPHPQPAQSVGEGTCISPSVTCDLPRNALFRLFPRRTWTRRTLSGIHSAAIRKYRSRFSSVQGDWLTNYLSLSGFLGLLVATAGLCQEAGRLAGQSRRNFRTSDDDTVKVLVNDQKLIRVRIRPARGSSIWEDRYH